MREAALEAGCRQDAAAVGFDFPKLSTGRVGRPDRLLPLPDAPAVYVELKTPRGRISKPQEREHVRLRSLGYRVEVIRTRLAFRYLLCEYSVDARSRWM